MSRDIRLNTTVCFDNINFGELNDRWIDEVIGNEFTEASKNDITISILFVNDVVLSLRKLATLCEDWCQISNRNTEISVDKTSEKDSGLWTFLEEINVSIQQIQGLIYLLIIRNINQDSSILDREIGLAAAKLYFACLNVPGSAAYSVYHPNLYRLCIDCLTVRDISKPDEPDWRSRENLSSISSALQSLIPLLGTFHLGSDASTVEHTVKMLVQLVACEVSSSNINFELDFLNMIYIKRYPASYVITALAYRGLSSFIESDLNGDRDENYSVILSHMKHHILCSKIENSATIPQKYLVVKENAVSFMCFNLRKDLDLFSGVTQTALKYLCLYVNNKAEFRSIVSQAVFTVMYSLKVDDLVEMIQWILLLADADDTNNRVFSLDLLGCILTNTKEVDSSSIPESQKIYLTKFPIIFSILTRCDDISPNVRAKALGLLAQHIKCILDFLESNKSNQDSIHEEYGEDFDYDTDVNGNHRKFWYNLDSCRKRLDEISCILQRRMDDNNATSCKAAVQALESLIIFDKTYLNEDNLQLFILASEDNNVTTRKQVIQSLIAILDALNNESEVQECWIRCVLPLAQDCEATVQAKALTALEEQFLGNIFSINEAKQECAFNLLKKLCFGENMSYETYLQKAFSIWKSEKKLGSLNFEQLEKYFRSNEDESKWFYLSVLVQHTNVPIQICDFTVEQFKIIQNSNSWPPHMEYHLKVLSCVCGTLSSRNLTSIQAILREKLKCVTIPIEFISLSIEVLCKVEGILGNEEEMKTFACVSVKRSASYLSSAASKNETDDSIRHLIPKHLGILQEFCLSYPSNITWDLVLLLKNFCFGSKSSGVLPKVITPDLQAHSLVALGKLCLVDWKVAEELIPSFARKLMTAKHDVVRNNAVIVMADMCKRYTSIADTYLHVLISCFTDKVFLIRYQTISLVITLLQDGFIRWKGSLFFCLLYTIIDIKEPIQELGKHCLGDIYNKTKSIFADNFVDSVFVFNNYVPRQNRKLANLVREVKEFSLKGERNREKRLDLYKYMLAYMDIPSRAYLVKQLCDDILSSVADGVFPVNKTTESMVRDCFAIISSKEIRVYDGENIPDMVEEGGEEEFLKVEVDTRKIMIVIPVIPVVISLKNCVLNTGSHLVDHIVEFLRDLLEDYKSEIEDILSDDLDLLRHIELQNQIENTDNNEDEDIQY